MFARLASTRLVRTQLIRSCALSLSIPRRTSQPTHPPAIDPSMEALKATKVFQTAHNDPELFDALLKFIKVLRAHGMGTSTPSSPLQMTRALLNPKICEALEEVMDACHKAGVSEEDIMQDVATFTKLGGSLDLKN